MSRTVGPSKVANEQSEVSSQQSTVSSTQSLVTKTTTCTNTSRIAGRTATTWAPPPYP